jgi:hypothetical protein
LFKERWLVEKAEKICEVSLVAPRGVNNAAHQTERALDLAASLLTVLPDNQVVERDDEEEEGYKLPPKPRVQFDIWRYKEIVEKYVPDLVDVAGEKALTLLCDLLETAIRLSRLHEENEEVDYSHIWRPAIENHEQNRSENLKSLLVSSVRDAAERLGSNNPEIIPNLVSTFEARQWPVFHRLTLHLLRVCKDTAPALVAKQLTERSNFDNHQIHHEYMLLMRDCFATLSPDDQATILSWISTGPDIEEFKSSCLRWDEKLPTEEEIKRHGKIWTRDKLIPIAHALPPEWKEKYTQLISEFGQPKYPEFTSYVESGSYGLSSPKSEEELTTLSIEELLSFLRIWQPSTGDFREPSLEGLGKKLGAVVTANPEHFAVHAVKFQELPAPHIHAFLAGFRDAARANHPFSWQPVLEFCYWVVSQQKSVTGEDIETKNDERKEQKWKWTREAIAELLKEGFQNPTVSIPIHLRTQAWQVLEILTNDPDPLTTDEGSGMGPATQSINCVRGEAMHAVVLYALWLRRHMEKEPDKEELLARGFDKMPEVRTVLEDHLDPDKEFALAVRAIYGQWFPWLYLLDRAWTTSHLLTIFPREENYQHFRNATWETYVVFCSPFNDVLPVLQGEYAHAIDRIGTQGCEDSIDRYDPNEHLAYHVLMFYFRGELSLDEQDGLLRKFYERAPLALRENALSKEGWRLYKTEEMIPQEVIDRFKRLWEWSKSGSETERRRYLNPFFYKLFSSICM